MLRFEVAFGGEFFDKKETLVLKKILGAMIGSAYGDSLGAAVEFLSLEEIKKRYGANGIECLAPAFRQPAGVITDDTQMAIATARGLVASPNGLRTENPVIMRNIWISYQEWLDSQGKPSECRAAGLTCTFALISGTMGSRQNPPNRSAGCGGVMRVHPIGLAFRNDPERAFLVGMDSAAFTHGDPDGYVPAGALAALIAYLVRGHDFPAAVEEMRRLVLHLGEEGYGTMSAVRAAFEAPTSGDYGSVIDQTVGRCGARPGGWLGHDALAIALYAVRVALDDPIRAVQIAVNHSGDSDSTGAIAGAIVGSIHGPCAFKIALKEQGVKLEREAELRELSQRLLFWGQEEINS